MFFLAKFYRSDKRESLTWKFKNSVYCLSYRRQQLKLYWPEGQYSWHPIRALKIFSIKLLVVLRLFAMWVRKGIALITRGDKLLSFFYSALRSIKTKSSALWTEFILRTTCYHQSLLLWSFLGCSFLSLRPWFFAVSVVISARGRRINKAPLWIMWLTEGEKARKKLRLPSCERANPARLRVYDKRTFSVVSVALMVEAVFSYHRSPCMLAFTCGSIVDQWRT